MGDWIPKPDVGASAKFAVVIPALVADPTDFGLVEGDVSSLAALRTAFDTKLAASDAAKAALATAVSEKDAARAAVEAALRPLIARVQVAPSVTDAVKVAAGIPLRDTTRTFVSPIVPAAVVASLATPTTARLAWSANGNTSGIKYRVEKKAAGASDWVLVDVTTKTKLDVPGLTAGVACDFRVAAQRGNVVSDFAATVSVYR